jgi:L,D-transpeptidase catalytic domain/Putative peptidoglycan binding domain
VRRGLVSAIALLALAPSATAAHRTLAVQATPTEGAAPLTVTFTAPAPASWDFGDGTFGSGQMVEHTYSAGRWIAGWTAGGDSGSIPITAHGIELTGPARVRYRHRATFRGRLIPGEAGVAVQISGGDTTVHATSKADGSFVAKARILGGGSWTAATGVVSSPPLDVAAIPQLRTGLLGSGARGSRFVFAASLRPRGAGVIDVQIRRGDDLLVDRTFDGPVRIRLDSRRLTTYVIRAAVHPNEGFTSAIHVLRAHVVFPRLAFGASGITVAQLGSRLRTLHYATPFTATFDSRLLDSVYAFQKVQGLPRTGRVDAAFWRRLADPRLAVPRYASPADHIEIDKPHQVLYVVRDSRVALIVPVSTAGIAGRFTPTGRFAIYRKVLGFDPSPLGTLFDPMYFTDGYAIHGNPSVPPYPASHGCVRVPMWIAPYLYATNPYGETVYVY